MSKEIQDRILSLVNSFCEERKLRALHEILPGYFSQNGFTDGVVKLGESIQNTLVFAKNELSESELVALKDLKRKIDDLLI